MELPAVHLLTCPQRADSLQRTLASWAATDWGAPPRVHLDEAPESAVLAWGTPARSSGIVAAFYQMLHRALAIQGPGTEWLLLLEDDILFHPRLAACLRTWEPLRDPTCSLATLFNPSLRARTPGMGRGAEQSRWSRQFAAEPTTFLGAQALLLRRSAAKYALLHWLEATGMQSQRLARLLGENGPIYVHRPSLVQHVATESSWGVRVQRALDFDPAWVPTCPAPTEKPPGG